MNTPGGNSPHDQPEGQSLIFDKNKPSSRIMPFWTFNIRDRSQSAHKK